MAMLCIAVTASKTAARGCFSPCTMATMAFHNTSSASSKSAGFDEPYAVNAYVCNVTHRYLRTVGRHTVVTIERLDRCAHKSFGSMSAMGDTPEASCNGIDSCPGVNLSRLKLYIKYCIAYQLATHLSHEDIDSINDLFLASNVILGKHQSVSNSLCEIPRSLYINISVGNVTYPIIHTCNNAAISIHAVWMLHKIFSP
jgi:hypothetical protein